MFRRHFTIMVLPDAHLRLRRFHLRGSHLVWGLAATGLIVGLALSAPVLGLWANSLKGELTTVRQERDKLAERSQETETALRELRERLDKFEKKAGNLAAIVGVPMASTSAAGQGQPGSIQQLEPSARYDVLRNEAEDLSERSDLLGRRIDSLEKEFGRQAEKLSHVPTLLPVRGLLGAGYGWRRDPFTGQRQFHRGFDLVAPIGTPVLAPADGVVLKTERDGGYGNSLYVGHGDGLVTRYAHLSAFKVQPGEHVKRGQVIAAVGNTGRSTGSHLHLEIMVGGKQVDPSDYFLLDDGSN